jgi:hypothetical protein
MEPLYFTTHEEANLQLKEWEDKLRETTEFKGPSYLSITCPPPTKYFIELQISTTEGYSHPQINTFEQLLQLMRQVPPEMP